MNKYPPLYNLLLNIQGALINAVTPELRAVTVDIDNEKALVILKFFYDGKITDELFETASIAGTETDVPGYLNDEHIIRCDSPNPLPIQGRFVFLRKEPKLPKLFKENWRPLLEVLSLKAILFLSMQEALLGKVTPELRYVCVKLEPEKKELWFYFFYDGKISEENWHLAKESIREVSSIFSEHRVHQLIKRVDFPNELPSIEDGKAIFFRRELIF